MNDSRVIDARRRLCGAVLVSFSVSLIELVGGLISNSLAIIADAAHDAIDGVGFVLSLAFLYCAHRSSSKHFSFGSRRAEVLGAVASVSLIWMITGGIIYESIVRIQQIISRDPAYRLIDGSIMLGLSLFGLLCNILITVILGHGHSHFLGGHGHSHDQEGSSHGHTHSHGSHDRLHLESSPGHNHSEGSHGHSHLVGSHGHSHSDISHGNDHSDGSHAHIHTESSHSRLSRSLEMRKQLFNFIESRRMDIHSYGLDQAHGHNHSGSSHGHSQDCSGDSDSSSNLEGSHGHNHLRGSHSHNYSGDSPGHNHDDDREVHSKENEAEEDSSDFSYIGSLHSANTPRDETDDFNVISKLTKHGHGHGESGEHEEELACQEKDAFIGSHGHLHEGVDEHAHVQAPVVDINVSSAYAHAIGHVLQDVGVIVASILIWIFQTDYVWQLADPICTILFSLLGLVPTIPILGMAFRILMQAIPSGMDILAIKKAIEEIEEVESCHELHMWSLSVNDSFFSAHIVIKETVSDSVSLTRKVRSMLLTNYGISHAAIQVEASGHECMDLAQRDGQCYAYDDEEEKVEIETGVLVERSFATRLGLALFKIRNWFRSCH